MQMKQAQKQRKIKHNLEKKKACKIIFENLELALDRAKQAELREMPFNLLKLHMFDSITQAFTD